MDKRNNLNKIIMKTDYKKAVLLSAIVLQFISLFLNIVSFRGYDTYEIYGIITGFNMVSDGFSAPVMGILSVLWIAINFFIMKKTFTSNVLYVVMLVFNILALVLYLLFTFIISSHDICSWHTIRFELNTGFYVLLLSFILYVFSYVLLSFVKDEIDEKEIKLF